VRARARARGLRYPAYNAHARCCDMWPNRLYNIFPHDLLTPRFSGGGGGGGVIEFCETLRVVRKEWGVNINVHLWSCTRYSCQIVLRLEFSRLIFDKFSNIVLHKNASSGSRGVPCERTDRQGRTADIHDEANSRFSERC
jgi:hypothetical protein